jgi:hypothetical protein
MEIFKIPKQESVQNNKKFPEGILMSDKGDPLLLYRGSSMSLALNKEERYSPEHLGYSTEAPSAGEAYFFTDKRGTADYYSRGKEPNKESSVRNGGDPHIDKVYVIMQNPFIHDFKGKFYREEEETYYNLLKQAKEGGYDGVIFKNTFDGGEYSRLDAIMHGRFSGENIYGVFNSEQVLVRETESLVSQKRKEKILETAHREREKRKQTRSDKKAIQKILEKIKSLK